jgi:UDP-glucose 4-epimerase
LEVIEAIEKVANINIKKQIAPRREGNPAQLVANSAKIRKVLVWSPRYDDLEFIVQTALARERNPRF